MLDCFILAAWPFEGSTNARVDIDRGTEASAIPQPLVMKLHVACAWIRVQSLNIAGTAATYSTVSRYVKRQLAVTSMNNLPPSFTRLSLHYATPGYCYQRFAVHKDRKQTYGMREIPLTKGQVALVDDRDYERLTQRKWCADWSHPRQRYYAVRVQKVSGMNQKVYMHREVLGLSHGDGIKVDHKNRNTLDNCRENLRIVSTNQNALNSKLYRTNTSGYRGVYRNKRRGKPWIAAIMVNYRNISLGSFATIEEAAKVRREAEAKHFGEFSPQ